jgi:DNA transposition AAA+ family ATPase
VGRVAHAVCYVDDNKAYLDFNNRKYFLNLERCGRSLREIATEVAESFKSNWTSVSEFTYDYKEGRKRYTRTVGKTDPAAQDADAVRN